MSDERRKINKHSTGTVPKSKYRNYSSYSFNECDGSRGTDYFAPDSFNTHLNPRRNQNFSTMDTGVEEHNMISQNGSINYSSQLNGSVLSNSSSRRNSSSRTPKCDNVTKYPDKKQIEDKLNQIREYLRVTNSLMINMKNTDDQINDNNEREHLSQMIKDLKDSEEKLVNILEEMEPQNFTNREQILENGVDNFSESLPCSSIKNEEITLDSSNHDIDSLRKQQHLLMQLQQKAENKLRDARQIQEKLYSSGANRLPIKKENICSEQEFDAAIKELEERTRRLKEQKAPNTKVQDKLLAEVDSLHNQIMGLHNANNERSQLIDVLDNRDAELRTQQVELQTKLWELQDRKKQVDLMVSELQMLDDADEDDVGVQVRKIVTMKDQLAKLKDMLEMVKTTENLAQNSNSSGGDQDICAKAEQFLQKCSHTPNTNTSMNVNRQKQINKNGGDGHESGSKRRSLISDKLALQAEVESKKRELEEIMGKHKAGTSNLNHDVSNDNKSAFGFWQPIILSPPNGLGSNQQQYSSDDGREEDDDDEYSELEDNPTQLPTAFNYVAASAAKHRPDINAHGGDYANASEYGSLRNLPYTPERVKSSSLAPPGTHRDEPRPNSTGNDHKSQVQKQLQLIKSVCDSMLEQQSHSNTQNTSNVHQLRNNLSPSPLYSEPRRFASPNPQPTNALNVTNTDIPFPWFSNSSSNVQNEIANYQSWLATNSIQTQSFMLNTLNQCCQMLWLQQRELQSLRNSVTMLQERMNNVPCERPDVNILQPDPAQNRLTNQYRPTQKVNHVSAACSLPNLNHYNATPSNLDPVYVEHNNIQNARLLDQCLNNANHLGGTQSGDATNNTIVHGVNAINHTMPAHVWNGQALNNQVPPGNRANNYWDNFRSYSRQNLLSTKNSEGFQNLPSNSERSNIGTERTNPFTLMSFSKSNSEHDSGSTSQEHTPQRRISVKTTRQVEIPSTSAVPPDVLNVDHKVPKIGDQGNVSTTGLHDYVDDLNSGFQAVLNLYADGINLSNNAEEQVLKGSSATRRNEWNSNEVGDEQPKSKLFEELRENVYKEVASLISANESRPHFLIQLFRDLQMICSDPLRLKILQSIQTVITHSLMTSQGSSRNPIELLPATEQDPLAINSSFSLQSTVWSKSPKNTSQKILKHNKDQLELQNGLKEVVPFLNEHDNELIQQHFLIVLKQKFIESDSFQETIKDSIFQKHFSNVLDEVLDQYRGKKVHEVKMHLIQNLQDLLQGELSFIRLLQQTCPENTNLNLNVEPNLNSSVCFESGISFDIQNSSSATSQIVDNKSIQIQNGDLAEADQSQPGNDLEDEGAVGGLLEVVDQELNNCSAPNNIEQGAVEEIEFSSMDYPNSEQGLDQVPTRLPTKARSRSTTPN